MVSYTDFIVYHGMVYKLPWYTMSYYSILWLTMDLPSYTMVLFYKGTAASDKLEGTRRVGSHADDWLRHLANDDESRFYYAKWTY